MAKVVIVELDGELAMAVLPANRKVILQDLRDVTGCDHVSFVEEDKFKSRFPDCEIGAMPPFGNLYGMEVFVADSLGQCEEIAFNAGSTKKSSSWLTPISNASSTPTSSRLRPEALYGTTFSFPPTDTRCLVRYGYTCDHLRFQRIPRQHLKFLSPH